MGWTIFFIVLAVLCFLLLLPVRVRFAVHGKKQWQIKVYYACFPLFTKGKPEPAEECDEPSPEDDMVSEEDLLFIGSGDGAPMTADIDRPSEDAKRSRKEQKKAALPEALEEDEDIFTPKENARDAPKPKKKGLLERVKPKGIGGWLELIDDALASVPPPVRFLLRHFYIRRLNVGITTGTKDPAKTAILYGLVCNTLYRTLGRLQCHISVKAEAIRVRADFFNPYCTAQCSGEMCLAPMTALGLAFGIVIPFLWRTLWRVRRQEKQQRLEDAESAPLPAA